MRRKATLALLVFLFTAGTSLVPAQTPAPHLVLAADNGKYERQQTFGPGGQLVIDGNVADLAVRHGDAGTLKLVIDPRDSHEGNPASWVREFTVSRQYGKIQLDLPKHSGGGSSPHVTLYVPGQTSVRLSLSVGNVALDALSGNVEVDIGVGNLNVGALDTGKYHDVVASVGIGDISDKVFGMNPSGMLGKDASYHGNGQLKMKLHAKIGNLEIDKGDPTDH